MRNTITLDQTVTIRSTCESDLNMDDEVGFADLLSLLGSWGNCTECPADLDEDEVVGFADLLVMLAQWGPCQ